jgi:AraC-like DNA-binding protein
MIGRPPFLTNHRNFLSLVTGHPGHALGRSESLMAADALSDLFKTVRLTGATFFDLVCGAPWVAESPPRDMILPKILPGAEHLIAYHVITQGRCFAGIIGEEPTAVEAGEVIVFTRCDPHVMSSSPGMRADPLPPAALDGASPSQLPFYLTFGEREPVSTKLVCGYLACDARPFNPLLDNLPRVIKSGDPRREDQGWLGQFIRLATMESKEKRAGGESVLAKLSELMFIEVVRRHLAALPPEQAGWLAGLRDPFIGKALSLMHGRPAQDWTIEELAKQVGLSRSVLAERFSDLVGMPPIQYLANWRMQIATGLLSSGNPNIATIAAEVGYGSEAAFSRAFKKIVGVPPSDWRRRVIPGGQR